MRWPAWSAHAAAAAFLIACLPAAAFASGNWPEKPIKLIVPFPPGGGGDNMARLVMNRVAQELGQPLVVENLSGAGGKVRLAPLYDISSALPYPALQKRKIKMAMKIGSHYRWWDIQLRDWQATAEDMHLDADDALRTLARMCLQLPRQAGRLLAQFRDDGIGHKVLDRLVGEIEASCRRCLQQFKAPSEA